MKRKFDQISKQFKNNKNKYVKGRFRKKRRRDFSLGRDLPRENKLLKMYYVAQKIFSDDDSYGSFFKVLKENLPVTFRVNLAIHPHVKEYLRGMLLKFSKDIVSEKIDLNKFEVWRLEKRKNYWVENSDVDEKQRKENLDILETFLKELKSRGEDILKGLFPLAFYDEKLAFQLNISKNVMSKLQNKCVVKFRKFLVAHTKNGNITRQEMVSMIPPVMFDIHADSKILDLCSAPGSKTSQLIERLHDACVKEGKPLTGFVCANDIDNKRIHTLMHQIQRLKEVCANVFFTCSDGRYFPFLMNATCFKFDCILADVMCSGDGTFRKQVDLWRRWTPELCWALHPLQVACLDRCFHLLEDNGQLVYSTCSMNPLENEAVVATLLRKYGDQIELVDLSQKTTGLKFGKGLTTWKVFDKVGVEVCEYDEEFNKKRNKNSLKRTFFPPSDDEVKVMNLHRCARFYPNLMNSGGFFVAKFIKKSKKMNDKVVLKNSISSIDLDSLKSCGKFQEFKNIDDKIVTELETFFGLEKNVCKSLFCKIEKGKKQSVLSQFRFKDSKKDPLKSGGRPRKLYFANGQVSKILGINTKIGNWWITGAGVRVFDISPVKRSTINYRLTICGAEIFNKFMTKRKIGLKLELFEQVLNMKNSLNIGDIVDGEAKDMISSTSNGSLIFHLQDNEDLFFLVFKTDFSLNKNFTETYAHSVRLRLGKSSFKKEIEDSILEKEI